LTLSPQLTSFFFPSNHKNIFTVLLSSSLQYDLDPVGIMINPMVDLCGNAGAVHIEYGFYKKSRINHNLNIDSRLLMGWGNASFTDYFLPISSPILKQLRLSRSEMRDWRFLQSISAAIDYSLSRSSLFIVTLYAHILIRTEVYQLMVDLH
jgi:hypothetical protein